MHDVIDYRQGERFKEMCQATLPNICVWLKERENSMVYCIVEFDGQEYMYLTPLLLAFCLNLREKFDNSIKTEIKCCNYIINGF